MKGFVTATVYEGNDQVQQVKSTNSVMESAVTTLLSDVFYGDYTTYDSGLKVSLGFDSVTQNNYIPDLSSNNQYAWRQWIQARPYSSGALQYYTSNLMTFVDDGVYGKAGHFDGNTFYGTTDTAYNTTDDFSMECWFRASDISLVNYTYQTYLGFTSLVGSSSTDQAAPGFILRLANDKYRLYYEGATSSSYYTKLMYTDTTDTNPPDNTNVGGAKVVLYGDGTVNNRYGSSIHILRLPNNYYRIYFGYSNGTYWRLSYMDTTDTNPPDSTNLSGVRNDIFGTGTSDQAASIHIQVLPSGKYRIYYVYYNGTYWGISYNDTTNTDIPDNTNIEANRYNLLGSSTSDMAGDLFIVQLPNNKYRIYHAWAVSSSGYWRICYKDTLDTNLPNSTNLIGSTWYRVHGEGSASAICCRPFLLTLSNGKKRMYMAYGNGTYYIIQYSDSKYGAQCLYQFCPSFYHSATYYYGKAVLFINENVPFFRIQTASTSGGYADCYSQAPALTPGKWYHIGATHSNIYGNMLFIDGVLVGYEPSQTTIHDESNPTGWSSIGCYWQNNSDYSKPSNFFYGDIDGLAFTSTIKYKGNVLNQKYFNPSRKPQIKYKSFTNSTANKLYYLILTNAVNTTNRYDGNMVDDFVSTGSYVKIYNYLTEIFIDLLDVTTACPYTKTVTVLSDSSIKLTVTIPANYGEGVWNTFYLTDNCIWAKSELTKESFSYPIVAKITLPTPIHKSRKQTLVIEWTLTLSTS